MVKKFKRIVAGGKKVIAGGRKAVAWTKKKAAWAKKQTKLVKKGLKKERTMLRGMRSRATRTSRTYVGTPLSSGLEIGSQFERGLGVSHMKRNSMFDFGAIGRPSLPKRMPRKPKVRKIIKKRLKRSPSRYEEPEGYGEMGISDSLF